MQTPEQKPQEDSSHNHFQLARFVFVTIIILIIAIGIAIWVYLSPSVAIVYTVLAGAGTLIAFLQVIPSLFSTPKSESRIVLQFPPSQHTSISPTAPIKDTSLSPSIETQENEEEQLYTALDIGTAYAKAIIFKIIEDEIEVLGVGRHQQSYRHMSDGIVTDITGVIANCNEALIKAEKAAGGIVAPSTVIGIAGELVGQLAIE